MDYIEFLNREIDINGVKRVNDRGEIGTQTSGPSVTVRDFLSGLERAYSQRAALDAAIASMEAFRKENIVC